MNPPLLLCALAVLARAASHADDLLPTLMTTRGTLLDEQNFEKPLPSFDGKSNGFASGFKGWRFKWDKNKTALTTAK